MPTGTRVDPYRGFNFLVEIDGITQAGFQEVSGLDSSTPSLDYREGTDPMHVRKLSGLTKFGNITLKRGITDDMDMWKWRKLIEEGKIDEARKNGTITMYNQEGKPIAKWSFVRAWPSKLTGPTANATNNEVGIEELEITHEGYARTQ